MSGKDNQLRPGYRPKKQPESWHSINRTGLQDWAKSNLRYTKAELAQSEDEACPLFPHQHVIKDYLQEASPYRSLILYQGLGTGKTRASIAIAEVLSTKHKIIVMVPASLEGNYREEIVKCANESYRTKAHWQFKNTPTQENGSYAKILLHAKERGVSEKTIKANKGIWYVDEASDANFDSLSPVSQAQIVRQIDDMISKRYKFVHYNGLSTASASKLLEETNSFANHIVIIDEVHNFISRVVNNSRIAKTVYNALVKCTTCKLLLLSGTPIINKPFELASLCNLSRGNLQMLLAKGDLQTISSKRDEISATLDRVPWIDHYEINTRDVLVIPVPPGFVWADDTHKEVITRSADVPQTYDDMIKALYDVFVSIGFKKGSGQDKAKKPKIAISLESATLFPDDEKVFDEMFVDYTAANASPIKNPLLIARRLQGIISHFETFDAAQFPEVKDTQYIKVEMPPNTFALYMNKRNEEVLKEENAKRQRGKHSKDEGGPQQEAKNGMSSNSVYRCYTRALCDFSFPRDIQRPYPSNLRIAVSEMDDLDMKEDKDQAEIVDNIISSDEEEGGSKKHDKASLKKEYTEALDKALKEIHKKRASYLVGEGLKETSPKYAELIKRVGHCTGPTLVYSQFRNVEGHGILSFALEAHGYTELNVKKDTKTGQWELDIPQEAWDKPKFMSFSSDKDKNKLLLAIFNSEFTALPPSIRKQLENHGITNNLHGEFVKLIMITQSGAEGISLKNVRQVHILEPYWNPVRIKQVIGRAVRAGSHLALPKEERVVDVFMYLMVFSKDQKKNQLVHTREEGLTSDEYILNVARKKGLITETLLNLMKSAAVDCLIHKKPDVQCLSSRIPRDFGNPKGVMYSYQSITHDVTDDVFNQRVRVARPTLKIGFLKLKKAGVEIQQPYNIETKEVYNKKEYEEGRYVVIGRVVEENGAMRIVKV